MVSINRRSFLALAAASLIPTDSEVEFQTKFGDWLNNVVVSSTGPKFTRPEVFREVSANEIAALDSKLIHDAKQRYGEQPQITNSSYTSTTSFREVSITKKDWREYTLRTSTAISNFLKDLNLTTPIINFHRLTPLTNFQPRSDISIPIYVVGDINIQQQGEYIVKIRNKIKQPIIILPATSDGFSGSQYQFFVQNGAYQSRLTKRNPLFLRLSKNATNSYTGPLAETLHAILEKTTAEHKARDLTILGIAQANQINSRWSDYDEAVVHASVELYLEDKLQDLAIPAEQFRAFTSHHRLGKYALIPKVKQTGLSPRKIISMYKTQPEELFK
jgi:hypothetical protein